MIEIPCLCVEFELFLLYLFHRVRKCSIMIKFFINLQEVEGQVGDTIIVAAARNKIDIPHFCWHPELPISGSCRMCLVEVGSPKRNQDGSVVIEDGKPVITYMPKLQPACNTVISEGMCVNTDTQKCIDARSAVIEFTLINHPLDCPICDEAGQCKLQDYSAQHSCQGSRFTEEKNPNPKRIEWNDKIVYDAERCIFCSRCIRFMSDVMKEDVLTFVNRGDKVMITRFNDAELQSDYSMNIIDNCPCGALTSKDFRFKSRVWEMNFNYSICNQCSRLCQIRVGMKMGEVLRVEGIKYNDPVKGDFLTPHYICDFGRLNVGKSFNEDRLSMTQIRLDNVLQRVDLALAIKHAAKLIKNFKPTETYILASPLASNESNAKLLELAREMRVSNIGYIQRYDSKFGDDFLKRNERSPNHFGLAALGINAINEQELVKDIKEQKIRNLIILDEDLAYAPLIIKSLGQLDKLILFSPNNIKQITFSDVCFAVPHYFEYSGTFTNCNNKEVKFKPIVASSKEEAIDRNLDQSRWEIFGMPNDKWYSKRYIENMPSNEILEKILKLL